MSLLSPIRVGTHQLRNRVVMASLHTRLEYMDRAQEREVAFYRERAKGGVALIITSGFSPNEEGRIEEGSHILGTEADAHEHRPITEAVHAHGAKIVLQILHCGRYSKHDQIVGVSTIRSPINPRVPRRMDEADIERTIADFVHCAELAKTAGYDGVELMGSEGYLINQFTAERTNDRTDRWGGTRENRCRFSGELVSRIRQRLGPDFMILYRISAVDLVERGRTAQDIAYEAQVVEKAGADALDTGIGWHEARVPTIAYQVPRAAFSYAAANIKHAVKIPVIASNRINTPEIAEGILACGEADMVALGRPMLADPHFVLKVEQGRSADINVCIACNQACLDHIFSKKVATCLVNPKACREIEFDDRPPARKQRVAVVGSGPAGLSFAVNAAARGHEVVLFEADADIGGQLNLARRIPGKGEFNELLRYFRRQLESHGVEVRVGTRATADVIAAGKFDRVVVAAGIEPRKPEIPGIDHPKVLSYLDVILGRVVPGPRVAIIGTGGIGYDVAEMLSHSGAHTSTRETFYGEWGVDPKIAESGGLARPQEPHPVRDLTMLQRSRQRPGSRLGASTGWILRARLKRRGVKLLAGCHYTKIDDQGLHITVDGHEQIIAVDHVVICAGQEPAQGLAAELKKEHIAHDLIGGARFASELDALRAIDEGTRLAYRI
jgi:2,4-dienoyl-CoA reductase (NADPH2)